MDNPVIPIPDISNLKIQDESDAVSKADKQAELLTCFIVISEKIRPKLTVNGANFNTWSQNMIKKWATVFLGDVLYFKDIAHENKYQCNLIALAFIQHRIEQPLFDSITSRLFMPKVFVFNPINPSSDLNQHALRLGEAIKAIENQMGTLDRTKILNLSLFFSMPHLWDKLTSALDTRLAINPLLNICPEDILDIVWQMSSLAPSSIINKSSGLACVDATRLPPNSRGRGKSNIPPWAGSLGHKSFGTSPAIMS
ncbi:hypothetical protein O181_024762 [Austropuccinia psidii MF-1]|uniref:Uncharacterized protein n=1 Tax=Austropuccinia psidii MF-1 TaxID=1389203 RepID=A0A9Q3CJX3_9BASI|nr:hypothetical protein [Austropuccinia psidii MF-1]